MKDERYIFTDGFEPTSNEKIIICENCKEIIVVGKVTEKEKTDIALKHLQEKHNFKGNAQVSKSN